MKYFFDTEFLDTGKEIRPISIGVVAEDGRELYYVVPEAMYLCRKSPWLMENVAPHLPRNPLDERCIDIENPHVRTKIEISVLVQEFLLAKDAPELWAWYGAYDYVALVQLFGRMIDLPDGIPMYTNDIRSLVHWYGIKKYPSQMGVAHNALEDARHNKVVFDYIMGEISNG